MEMHYCWNSFRLDLRVELLCAKLGDVDFLLPGPRGGRASFTFAQAQLQRLLVECGGVPHLLGFTLCTA